MTDLYKKVLERLCAEGMNTSSMDLTTKWKDSDKKIVKLTKKTKKKSL